ncbi:BnaC08g05050D [Brassica napus]|uniref:BnaC08g05050D protein n=1 Tax=Brassica napus TaxID=3708 RepID=A0A078HEZ9_BRANA|nr:BnaC08g05050D [Brassica napus]
MDEGTYEDLELIDDSDTPDIDPTRTRE